MHYIYAYGAGIILPPITINKEAPDLRKRSGATIIYLY